MDKSTKINDDLLSEIADELRVDVEILEERLEMVGLIPIACCDVNGSGCNPKPS